MNDTVQCQNPSFTSIVKAKVIPSQKRNVTNIIGNILEQSKEYSVASKKDVDVYFLKPRARDLVRVIYYDKKMGSFVRTQGDNILETTAKCPDKYSDVSPTEISSRICKTLNDIVSGKYKAPYWYYNPGTLIDQYNGIVKLNKVEL